jgi:hypothetical protein
LRISFKSLRAANLNSIGLSGVGLAVGVGLTLGEIVSAGVGAGEIVSTGSGAGEIDGAGFAESELVAVSEGDDAIPRKITPITITAFCQNFRALNLFNKFFSILVDS